MPAVAELVWKGKGRARPARRARLITDELHGAGAAGDAAWRNRLVHGEAERVLPALAKDLAGQVSLVYVDPPFDTGGAFDYLADVPGTRTRAAIPAYRDARGLDA